MATTSAKSQRVRVSATQNGTYNLVGYVLSPEITEGTEGGAVVQYLGGEINQAGNPTLSGTLDVVWDTADTNGQSILRSAKANGTAVWLEYLPAGTTSGSPYERFEATITQITRGSPADGDVVRGSFSFNGTPSTRTTGVLA